MNFDKVDRMLTARYSVGPGPARGKVDVPVTTPTVIRDRYYSIGEGKGILIAFETIEGVAKVTKVELVAYPRVGRSPPRFFKVTEVNLDDL